MSKCNFNGSIGLYTVECNEKIINIICNYTLHLLKKLNFRVLDRKRVYKLYTNHLNVQIEWHF